MWQGGWRLLVKRVLDVTVAGVGLVVTSPLLIAAGLAVRASMGSPILFRQTRPGRYGRPFAVYKLRTMRDAVGPDQQPLPDAQRLTRVGQLLRQTSLDELPQLVNVLKGELSLVGPRPLLMRYLERYTDEQRRRHDVLPGITGWAQINGRNRIAWPEKFSLDVWYVDHWSLCLDVRILVLTFLGVLRRDGISNEGHVTMPEFMGTD